MKISRFLNAALVLSFLSLAACNSPSGADPLQGKIPEEGGTSATGNFYPGQVPKPSQAGPAQQGKRDYQIDALIYNGVGAWSSEVASLDSILTTNHITFSKVTSEELNSMTVSDLAKYGVIIWPGGFGGTQTSSLTEETHANLRAAVQQKGVSYIGFCAGAFVAVAPAPTLGKDVSYGLGIVNGPVLDYYYLENQGVEAAMTMATFADGKKRDLVWYGGPVTPNFKDGVVAQYPNGQPMISETWSGNGFVILSAVHPTALQDIRDTFGLIDSDGLDFDVARDLILAALNQTHLPAFQ